MNACRNIQRRLLALSAPDDPPAALREHLEGCADCRDWQRRVVQVERGVALLPVAPSQAGVAFLREFRAAGSPWQQLRARIRLAPRWQVAWVSAAAAVLLMLGGLSLLPGTVPVGQQAAIEPVPPDPLVARLYQRNLDLAKTSTPQRQLETLANLAEDLRGESQSLAVTLDGRRLLEDVLASSYKRVVTAVVEQSRSQAKGLNDTQRQELLGPVERLLARASDDAERLERDPSIDSANHPLSGIASTARNARDKVKEILGPNKASALPRLPSGHGRRDASRFPAAEALLSRGNPLALFAAAGEEVQAGAQAAEQAQRFGRNRVVIQALVDNGIDLAGKRDPIERAACCADLAEKLTREIQSSVPTNLGRALGLGPYVGDLLKRGVAENLNAVPRGDPREAKLLQIVTHVRKFTGQLDPRVLPTVAFGRDEVEKTLQDRGL